VPELTDGRRVRVSNGYKFFDIGRNQTHANAFGLSRALLWPGALQPRRAFPLFDVAASLRHFYLILKVLAAALAVESCASNGLPASSGAYR
jgi:hypothetical protein